jgi:hypothetical protein
MKPLRSLPPLELRLRESRRGFTTPAVALALLVVMAGLALILDRLWLDAADLELTTAAESAALAAASELASDDLLRLTSDAEQRFDIARSAGAFIAGQNLVAGNPVVLNIDPAGDIRLGRLTLDAEAGKVRFDETTVQPTTAVVTAMRTRRSSNPVSLFVAGVTGQAAGDVVSRVEASVDNRVLAVRPADGVPVPALPLAIWWKDPAGQRLDTWQVQIEARKGQDQYGYDSVGHSVYAGSDGIPEMTLRSQGRGTQSANLLVVDLGSGLNDLTLQRQFQTGLTVDDLEPLGGELPIRGSLTVKAFGEVRHTDREALELVIGEPRICLLYASATPSQSGELLDATCTQLVAIRVLAIKDQNDGSCEIVVQPCVIKTKTAVLDVPTPYSTESVVPVLPGAVTTTPPESTSTATVTPTTPGNPYIYKVLLTH